MSPRYGEPQEGQGDVATFDFVPSSRALGILSPCLGTPENTRVTWHFRPLVGPREGRGEVATSDFVPLFGDPRTPTATPALPPTLTLTLTRSCGSHGRPWWGATHMYSGIDRGLSVLKHKYHRHLNHEGLDVGFWGSRQLSLFGEEGSSQGALSTPPSLNCKPGCPSGRRIANSFTLCYKNGSLWAMLYTTCGQKIGTVE